MYNIRCILLGDKQVMTLFMGKKMTNHKESFPSNCTKNSSAAPTLYSSGCIMIYKQHINEDLQIVGNDIQKVI